MTYRILFFLFLWLIFFGWLVELFGLFSDHQNVHGLCSMPLDLFVFQVSLVFFKNQIMRPGNEKSIETVIFTTICELYFFKNCLLLLVSGNESGY